jgi:hypothetical protein
MLSTIASAVTLRRLLLASVLVAATGGAVTLSSDPPRELASHHVQATVRFAFLDDISRVRANRWLEQHPDRACPTMDDVTTADERRLQGIAHLEMMCGDREHFGRRVVTLSATFIPTDPFDRRYD